MRFMEDMFPADGNSPMTIAVGHQLSRDQIHTLVEGG